MSAIRTDNKGLKRWGRVLSILLVSLLALCLLLFVGLKIYLATPLPAAQLSDLMTSRLGQKSTIRDLDLSGSTIHIEGIRIENPAGFPRREFFAADRVSVTPLWGDLLRGGRNFRTIAVDAGNLNLEKNAAGLWNVQEFQRRLAPVKPPRPEAPETVVGQLVIRKGKVTVQGQGISGIDLQVFNIASGGSRDAQLELAFEDTVRNRYLLKGTARPGADAAVDLSLTGSSLSLRHLGRALEIKDESVFRQARGVLQANAVLAKGELRGSGMFAFSGIQAPAVRGSYPVAGTLNFNGVYTLADDTAHLNEAILTLDKVAQLQAEGSVKGVRKEREFALLLGLDDVDLGLANLFLPADARRDLVLGGRLRCESLRLEGSGTNGLESAVGNVELKAGSVAKGGEILAEGVSGRATLTRRGDAVAATGRLKTAGGEGKAMVQALDLPFELALSPGMKPLRAQSNGLSATVLGLPLSGRVTYEAARPAPLAASLKVPSTKLLSLAPLLRRYGLEPQSGTISGIADLTGGAGGLEGSGRLQWSELKARRGKDTIAAKSGTTTVSLHKAGELLQATGEAQLRAFAYNGRGGNARFGYRLADNVLHLERLQADLPGADLSAAKLTVQLPRREGKGVPLVADLEGGALRQGGLKLANLAGRVRATLVTEGNEKWLEGEANLSSRELAWQQRTMNAPSLQVGFSKAGARGVLGGELMGGKVSGTAFFHPFAADAAASFKVAVDDARADQVGRLFPAGGTKLRAGTLDLSMDGTYSQQRGLAARFETKGKGLGLADAKGKTVVSGATASAAGRLSRDKLAIADASFSPGRQVVLRVKGELSDPFTPKRRGSFNVSLPETALNDVVESLLSLMPRAVQEATVAGAVAATARVELKEGRQFVEGGVTLKGVKYESTPQKLVVAGVDGSIPVSLQSGGKGTARPAETRDFSRANYARLLAQLRDLRPEGQVVTIDRVSLGTLELGKTAVTLRARNGLVEIASLRSTLYEGTLLGTGYLATGDRQTWRGDLVVNGVSLRTLCRNIPNLEGYISGRVDGVISVRGVGGGAKGLTGFVDLWAREGGGEKKLVSREFLQRLAKQKLSGLFLSRDRPYDEAEIKGTLAGGDLTFDVLKIVNRNLIGVRDLNVSIAPTQNRIALDHLLSSIQQAAVRGTSGAGEAKPGTPKKAPEKAPELVPEFKWEE